MNKYLIILVFILGFFSCRKNQDIISTTDGEYPVEQYVISSLKGKVVTDRDAPVKGAKVMIGTNVSETDFNGIFYFKNIKANKAGQTITVTKDGYTKASKVFYPELNATSYIKIVLSAARKTSIISTNDNDKIVGDELNEIQITGNDFIKGGTKYSGDIIMHWTFVSANDEAQNQVGDPTGFSKYFKLVGLNSLGTLGINVTDDIGNDIELSKKNTIELKLGMENSSSTLDDNIPLWRFSPEKGKWLETGKAVLLSDKGEKYYFAEVNKTGYYSFAKAFGIKKTKIKLESKNGNFLTYLKANITTTKTNNYKLQLISNDNGIIPCYVPEDLKSEISIIINEKEFKNDLNPAGSNDISIDVNLDVHKLKAKFFSCNSESISTGYITIINGNNPMYYFLNERGEFNEMVTDYNGTSSISWAATDVDSEINTGIHKNKLNESGEYDTGDIYLCQEPFALIRYGDESFLLDLVKSDVSPLYLEFENDRYNFNESFLSFHGEGEYKIEKMDFQIRGNGNEYIFVNDLKSKMKIHEYNKPGMLVGHYEGMARRKVKGEIIDTSLLRIDYSVFLN